MYQSFGEKRCLRLLLGRANIYPGDSPKMLTFKWTSSITTIKFPAKGASNIIRRSEFQHSVHSPYPTSWESAYCQENSESFHHHLILFCGWQLRKRKACNNSQNSVVLETEHWRDWWVEFKSGKKTSFFFLALACNVVAGFPTVLVRSSVTVSAIAADSHRDYVLLQYSITRICCLIWYQQFDGTFCFHHQSKKVIIIIMLGVLSYSLILKMKLVPPPLPWSSRVPSSFWSIL